MVYTFNMNHSEKYKTKRREKGVCTLFASLTKIIRDLLLYRPFQEFSRYLVHGGSKIENGGTANYPVNSKLLLKIERKGKLLRTRALSTISRQNQTNERMKSRKHVFTKKVENGYRSIYV